MLFTFFVSKTAHEKTPRTAAFGRLRPSNDIQVVSLESFVQGIKTRGARLVGPKRDSAEIFCVGFSGTLWFEFNWHIEVQQ